MKLYCWKLKKILDVEDDLNYLHLCFDREMVDSISQKITSLNGKIELPLNSFPIGNPKHLDVGLQKHNENYKEEIVEFKVLQIKIDNSKLEVNFSFIDDLASLELSTDNLKKLSKAIQHSKRFAYVYDNYLDAQRIISKSKKVKSKIIIWSGMGGDIVYC